MDFYKLVSNKQLYADIKKFKQKLKRKKSTPIPHSIQTAFYIMANKYSYKRNFIRYTYRLDMVSEAVLNCLKYIRTFNPDKSTNPYSYFTQAIHNTFLQFIAKEKKQSDIKETCLLIEIERRQGCGRKVGEKKKDYEDKIWD